MNRNYLNIPENIAQKIILTCIKEQGKPSEESMSNVHLFPPQYDLVKFLKFHEEEYTEEIKLKSSFGVYRWSDAKKLKSMHDINVLIVPRIIIIASETSSGKTRMVLSLCLKSTPRERKQISFNLFSDILFKDDCDIKRNCSIIVVPHTLVHQWIDEAKKIGAENVIPCASSNLDLNQLLENGPHHKICIMSINILKDSRVYNTFLTSHTFTRVVFDEVDAGNCPVQFVCDSLILVSATVANLLGDLGKEFGSQNSKSSLYGQIKYFMFSSRLPVVTIDPVYLKKYMSILDIEEPIILEVAPFLKTYMDKQMPGYVKDAHLVYPSFDSTLTMIENNLIFTQPNTIQKKIEEQNLIYKPSHFLIIIESKNARKYEQDLPLFFDNMDKAVRDISRGTASSIQKKIDEWTTLGDGLLLNLEQGTVAGLNLGLAQLLFFIPSETFSSGSQAKLIQVVNRAQRFNRETHLRIFKLVIAHTQLELKWDFNQELKRRQHISHELIEMKKKRRNHDSSMDDDSDD